MFRHHPTYERGSILMRGRAAFRSYLLARLLLCLTLLTQSSLALAAPSSLPNRAGQAISATSAGAIPDPAEPQISTTATANTPAASCEPNDCAIYLPWLVAGVPPT